MSLLELLGLLSPPWSTIRRLDPRVDVLIYGLSLDSFFFFWVSVHFFSKFWFHFSSGSRFLTVHESANQPWRCVQVPQRPILAKRSCQGLESGRNSFRWRQQEMVHQIGFRSPWRWVQEMATAFSVKCREFFFEAKPRPTSCYPLEEIQDRAYSFWRSG